MSKRQSSVLDWVERIGDLLPDPTVLFLWCTLGVMALSQVGVWAGWRVQPVKPVVAMETVVDSSGATVTRPVRGADGKAKVELKNDGALIECRSLLTNDGLYYALSTMVSNFMMFPPLGVVLVAMMGVGVAERTGFIGAALKAAMLVTPRSLLTPATIFVGANSSLAADAGFLVLPPLAAALYKSVGRSPLVGIAAVFAGVSGGFCANVLITSLDPLLSNLTQAGAQVLEPKYHVDPRCNWYFMAASTVLLTLVGWGITHWVIEKRVAGRPEEEGGAGRIEVSGVQEQQLTDVEKRGLVWGLGVSVAFGALVLCAAMVPGWPLYDGPETGTGASAATGAGAAHGQSPIRIVAAIVPLIFFAFLLPGLVYGKVTGKLRSAGDGVTLMAEAIAAMAPMLVMAFVAAQFIAWFKYSNLDRMTAFSMGAELARSGLSPTWLLIAFVGLTMIFNMFIGSASAKWAMMAPIFVPIFMLVGISPELTQAAYRVGDSVTNMITPLNTYVMILLLVMQRYAPKARMGTLLSLMTPYMVAFGIAWTVFLLVWMKMGWMLGPGGGLEYVPK